MMQRVVIHRYAVLTLALSGQANGALKPSRRVQPPAHRIGQALKGRRAAPRKGRAAVS
jgi:hypothetical protein